MTKCILRSETGEQSLGCMYQFGGDINICFLIEVMAVDDFQKRM